MNKFLCAAIFVGLAAVTMQVLFWQSGALSGEDEKPANAKLVSKAQAHGIPTRIPWTTSRITGTPEPPHPYRIVRVFPKLHFRNPLLITRAPGMNRFFVAEHQGKMYSFPMDEKCE